LSDRAELERRWLELTRTELPALADERGWPLRFDHCFQRVLLDAACEGCWYDRIEGRPAYRHAPDALLARAIELADQLLAGSADLSALNRQSLTWRGRLRVGK
jgi:hypothetical protein